MTILQNCREEFVVCSVNLLGMYKETVGCTVTLDFVSGNANAQSALHGLDIVLWYGWMCPCVVATVRSRMPSRCQMASFLIDIFSRFVFKLYVTFAVLNTILKYARSPSGTRIRILLFFLWSISLSLQFVCVSFMFDKGRRLSRPCELIFEGKAIPLQAWTGPEGSRRLRLPDFSTWRW